MIIISQKISRKELALLLNKVKSLSVLLQCHFLVVVVLDHIGRVGHTVSALLTRHQSGEVSSVRRI